MDLDEFAAEEAKLSPRGWVRQNIPEDIQKKLVARRGKIGVPTMTRWLQSLGYEGATDDRIRSFFQRSQ